MLIVIIALIIAIGMIFSLLFPATIAKAIDPILWLIYGVSLPKFQGGSAGGIFSGTPPDVQYGRVGTTGDSTVFTVTGPNGAAQIIRCEYGKTTSPFKLATPMNYWSEATMNSTSLLDRTIFTATHVFCIDHSKVVKFNKFDWTEFSTYNLPAPSGGYNSFGVALALFGNYLAALFTIVDNAWAENPDYQPSQVVVLDPYNRTGPAGSKTINQVEVDGSLDPILVGLNATSLTFSSEPAADGPWHLSVRCIGGKQHTGSGNGASPVLQLITIGEDHGVLTKTVNTLLEDQSSASLDYRSATLKTDGTDL